MNRLTLEERRRVYLAQRRAQARVLVRPQPETIEAFAPRSDPRRLRWIAVAAMIAALLGGGSSPQRDSVVRLVCSKSTSRVWPSPRNLPVLASRRP